VVIGSDASVFMHFVQGSLDNASHEKEKNAIDGKSTAQKQALSKEGTPIVGEMLNASKSAVESSVTNGN
jgi:hypothetical protein